MISLKQLKVQLSTDIASEQRQRKIETISLQQVKGRILAREISSRVDIPAHDVSAMDGYAFVGGLEGLPTGTKLQIIGESVAGRPFNGSIKAGECVRIMTGAVVPAGADSVEMQEYVEGDTQEISLLRHGQPKRNIRYQGEELSAGEVILPAGRVLQATDIGLIASVGVTNVEVYAPLKVGIFSTGDELVTPDLDLKMGEIYDSNRFMIEALLSDFPVEIINYGIISDDLGKIKTTLEKAAAECDVIITSGGVSVGDYDFLKRGVSELGEIRHYKVNMKPGKPFVYGKISAAWYFGLPGNPVSSFVCFQQIIAPALWQLAGGEIPPTLVLEVPLSLPVRKQAGRQDFQRGYLECKEGKWQVSPQGKQDSHRLYGLAQANCFIVLAAEEEDKASGDLVTVVPFSTRFNLSGSL